MVSGDDEIQGSGRWDVFLDSILQGRYWQAW